MAITRRNPNVIYLGGGDGPGGESGKTPINEYVAIEALTPGMVLEYHNDGGVLKWGVHDAADDPTQPIFALEQDELNLGVDDPYAAGDLVKAAYGRSGSTWWAIVASGQNFAIGALLQSNGDGRLKALGTGEARFRALEGTGGALAAHTRLRVEVI